MGGSASLRFRALPSALAFALAIAGAMPGCSGDRERKNIALLSDLETRLEEYGARAQGTLAVSFRDLRNLDAVALRRDEPLPAGPAGSLYVLIEAFRAMEAREIIPEETVDAEDRWPDITGNGFFRVSGDEGVIAGTAPPARVPFRDLVERAAGGDPFAVNAVVRRLGGPAKLEAAAGRIGEGRAKFPAYEGDPIAARVNRLPATTAADLAAALHRLWRGDLLKPDATNALRHLLERNASRRMIPRLLPPGAKVWHVSGTGTGTRSGAGLADAAVVETTTGAFALVILGDNLRDPAYAADLCGEIAALCEQHMRRR